MIIATIVNTRVLIAISARRNLILVYIVVIDQKDRSIAAAYKKPNIAPVINPSLIFFAPDHLRNRVKNKAVIRFEAIKAHQVICPRHGARFNIVTGAVEAPPAVVGIDTYEVKIDGDDILVRCE